MSLWQRFRESLRGPLRVGGPDGPVEVETALREEMSVSGADAAEPAAAARHAEETATPATGRDFGMLPHVAAPTIAYEGEQEAAGIKAAEASAPD